jgi:Zn-dependent protease
MFSGDLHGTLWSVSVWVLPILTAIPLHEAAHGLVAYRLGDDTAYRQGRVTLNPLRHVDPFGTIILPLMLKFAGSPFLFGYAKPVPVNFGRLHHPRRDTILVAAAGPVTNILLAFVSGLLLHVAGFLPPGAALWLAVTLFYSIVLNLSLAVFNMIPLPPLDGGRVLVGLLPRFLALPLARLERFGMLILLLVLVVLPLLGETLHQDLNLLPRLLLPPVNFLYNAVMTITGAGAALDAAGVSDSGA